jgi:broad specificity phosphatase PhoE
MTDLFLIRHAESYGNLVVQAQTLSESDGGLTDLGCEQARRLAERLARTLQPDVLYSSPTSRALQTAQSIGAAIGLPVHTHAQLVELRLLKSIEGLTSEAAREGWLRARRTPDEPAFPGGESFRQLQTRAAAAIDDILQAHPGKRIAVVTHGGLIEALFFDFLCTPLDHTLEAFIQIDYTAVFHWRRFQIDGTRGWQLIAANDTRHLGELYARGQSE